YSTKNQNICNANLFVHEKTYIKKEKININFQKYKKQTNKHQKKHNKNKFLTSVKLLCNASGCEIIRVYLCLQRLWAGHSVRR
ncbi:TPA: hypothetical protein ACIVF7_004816, partial [Salmonella enterica subsp. enterica serovar Typhimurium]